MFLNAYLNLSSLSSRIPLSLYLCLSTILASLFSHLPLIPLAPLFRLSFLFSLYSHPTLAGNCPRYHRQSTRPLLSHASGRLTLSLFPRLDALLLPAETISRNLLLPENVCR